MLRNEQYLLAFQHPGLRTPNDLHGFLSIRIAIPLLQRNIPSVRVNCVHTSCVNLNQKTTGQPLSSCKFTQLVHRVAKTHIKNTSVSIWAQDSSELIQFLMSLGEVRAVGGGVLGGRFQVLIALSSAKLIRIILRSGVLNVQRIEDNQRTNRGQLEDNHRGQIEDNSLFTRILCFC